ncbi:MAG: Transcriptional regulator, LysR family protein, partial [Rhodoferax sp.]|nr:Transcriptional regulator, LysR family protein [Rhodoferax sp.]
AEQELSHSVGAPRGKLRVSLPLVGMLLMPVLGRFIADHPAIALDLDFSDRMVNVIDDGFDVVVRTGEVSDSRLMARNLGTFRHQLVGSPAYFKRARVPRRPEDLLRHACLQHKFPSIGKLERWPLAVDGVALDLDLPATAVASTIEPLVHLAEQGLGITCVPDFAVRRQIAEGTLVCVLDDYIDHAGWFRAVWPSGRHLSPKVRVFVDFMVAHLFPEKP